MVHGADNHDPAEERRKHRRYEVSISVDYSDGDHFLFAYIENISEMGIFIRTDDPLPIGTDLALRFGSDDADRLELDGEVTWVNPVRADGDNPNPGMGVRFVDLSTEQRERVVELVRTVAYLQQQDHPN
jgi:type IV pilus assembly protein PilZ